MTSIYSQSFKDAAAQARGKPPGWGTPGHDNYMPSGNFPGGPTGPMIPQGPLSSAQQVGQQSFGTRPPSYAQPDEQGFGTRPPVYDPPLGVFGTPKVGPSKPMPTDPMIGGNVISGTPGQYQNQYPNLFSAIGGGLGAYSPINSKVQYK